INTAGEELLCTLPGVGSAKAKSIISYREKNGPFEKKEDIMNVEGIKNGLFEKIKDSITV
ncbi:MAG: helix-hairpin-helix domain-containing protein, partial [Lachnospiraceae bacterium]|nr:helix-hairpin-helix domain-containing protein [Lachnospiraceae bacterium]